jgi:hypothetical protein
LQSQFTPQAGSYGVAAILEVGDARLTARVIILNVFDILNVLVILNVFV